MNEQNSGTVPVESTPSPVPHKDRSASLIVFGILTILLGCLCGLLILLMVAGQAMAAKNTGAPAPFSTILPVLSLYGAMAVALIWLGIGSIMARRWARALLLIFSWSWLILGLLIMILMAFLMPKILANASSNMTANHPELPAASMFVGMMIGMFLFYGVFFVILPVVWTFFYSSRHVKATCETRDPITRWTDACPLPVLGLCLWLVSSVPMMLVMPLAGHCVMPFFGMLLTGLPGALLCLAIAALWGYAAWRLYKLDVRGWWLILIALCVFTMSGLVTFAQHDMMEMYRLMGYPEAQIEQIQKIGLLAGHRMIWMMSFSMLPFLGYLFFVRKFFPPRKS
ncbi:MAG: hypothetical protein ACLQAH_18315 [Limisphaerales bacterium]